MSYIFWLYDMYFGTPPCTASLPSICFGGSYVAHGVTWEASECAGLTDNRDLQKIPLYVHVAELAGTKQPFVLPVPFQNVLNGGKFLIPKNPARQSLSTIFTNGTNWHLGI